MTCVETPVIGRRRSAVYGWHYPSDGLPSPIRTVNPGFELPALPGNSFYYINEALVPGWETDDPTGIIEMWKSGAVDGVAAYEGTQVAEINYVAATRLFQTLSIGLPTVQAVVHWEWAHRARGGTGTNRAQMLLGETGTPLASHTVVSDSTRNTTAWAFLTGTWVKPSGVDSIDVSLRSITPAGGVGNLVDAVRLFVNRRPVVLIAECGEISWVDGISGEAVDPALVEPIGAGR